MKTRPTWNEGHIDWDHNDNVGNSAATNDGFVYTAAHDARALNYYDTDGLRAMGYYDGTDLNYYYWMASNFGTSDRFFNPTLSRTQSNREYLVAGTSGGYVYPEGTDADGLSRNSSRHHLSGTAKCGHQLEDLRRSHAIAAAPGPPYQASCLIQLSYIRLHLCEHHRVAVSE